MLFGISKKTLANYSYSAKKYLKDDQDRIMSEISECSKNGTEKISYEKMKNILRRDFPRAPWIEPSDLRCQIEEFFRQSNVLFEYGSQGVTVPDNTALYSLIVSNYLKLSGAAVLTSLAACCEKCHGKVKYEDLEELLGSHYPKAPWLFKGDKKLCLITFLQQTRIPFVYYEDAIYFP